MTMKRIASASLAALLALGAAGGIARAEEKGERRSGQDAAALAAMKVTLPQAIATAEQQAGGKAVSADLDDENGKVRIGVEVVGAQGTKKVLVDAQSGQVTATQDAGDHEDND